MFIIEVKDDDIHAALQALVSRVANAQPVLQGIGEGIKERTKQRFGNSTGPDGVPWAANKNKPSTLANYLAKTSGNFKKSGDLSKKGAARLAGKKPLIGQSRDLSRQFSVSATTSSVIVASSMQYAAMQQFGGTKAAFHQLWGDIPARPFLPVKQDGDLYPAERSLILDAFHAYLAGN